MTARGEPNFIARICSGWRAAALLLLIGLAVYLPGLGSIPPVDRDESRFAQASRQMLESVTLTDDRLDPELHAGGLIVPRVAGRPRLNKPPLIYWLQAGSAWVFTAGDAARDAIWMYRVPSVLGALVAVLATWWIGRTMMSEPAAVLGAAMLAVCPIVVWDAHQARADQVLLACTALAMGALWHLWIRRDRDDLSRAERWGIPTVFWIALGAGLMTKGVTLLVVSLAVVALCVIARRWRWLARTRPILGVVILALLVLPWVGAVGASVGWGEYLSILTDETLGRSASAKEGHGAPPGYHTVLAAALFWPGSLLTLGAFVHVWRVSGVLAPAAPGASWRAHLASIPRRWRGRAPSNDAAVFLLAWLVPGWVFFELISTKLPHYTMPMYPALALITAHLFDAIRRTDPGARMPAPVGVAVWAALGAVWVVAAPIGAASFLDGPVALAIAGAAVASLLLVCSGRLVRAGRIVGAHAWAIAASVVFAATLLGLVAPRLGRVWVSTRLDALLSGHAGPVGAVGYHEDSLVFLTRGRLERLAAEATPAWIVDHPDALLVLPTERAADIAPDAETLGEVRGLNYSNGDAVHLRIVRP